MSALPVSLGRRAARGFTAVTSNAHKTRDYRKIVRTTSGPDVCSVRANQRRLGQILCRAVEEAVRGQMSKDRVRHWFLRTPGVWARPSEMAWSSSWADWRSSMISVVRVLRAVLVMPLPPIPPIPHRGARLDGSWSRNGGKPCSCGIGYVPPESPLAAPDLGRLSRTSEPPPSPSVMGEGRVGALSS